MNVYTIILGRACTGQLSLSMVTRQETEEAAYAYAKTVIAQAPDLRIVEIRERPYDAPGGRRLRAAWLGK
jgi:hypothetical protein